MSDSPPTTITVGVHPNNSTLFVLRRSGVLEELLRPLGVSVAWREYPRGGQTVGLLADGSIDVAGTGATPPLLAQAKGLRVVYLAISAPRPEYGELLVLEDSPLRTVADLRGRRVGIVDGSWQTSFLTLALDDAGLAWDDVEIVSAQRPEGRRAFLAGEVDAWISGEPQHSEVVASTAVRRLVDSAATYSNRSLWFGRRDVLVDRPDVADALLQALQRTDADIARDPRAAAELFVRDLRETETLETWEAALVGRAWGPTAPDAAFVAEQQRVADLLADAGWLPKHVDVAAAVPEPSPRLTGSTA